MACVNPNDPLFKEILSRVDNPLLAELEFDFVNKSEQEVKLSMDAPVTVASTIFDLEPDITDEKIRSIYDNYVKLMDRKREGKGVPFDSFKKLMESYQVYKHKDTYIFGQYDVQNAVFNARMNSSPSTKQLFTEAIPNLVSQGVDFIAFLPPAYTNILKRGGYTVSEKSFGYDFKGEKMQKFAVASTPIVFQKIFKKSNEEVSSAELDEYNNSIDLAESPVEIREELIKKAGNDTAEILKTYLSQFGITVKDISIITEALGTDELGFADLLSKVAYTKGKKNLPPVAGEFIAYMMQYNPLIQQTINTLITTNAVPIPVNDPNHESYKTTGSYNYKTLNKDIYFKYIGKLIAEDLQNKTQGKYDKSLLQKIRSLITTFFDYLRGVDIDKINRNIGIISNNILQQNKKLITSSKYKPGAEGKKTKQVSLDEAVESDAFGKVIIEKLSKLGFILTGSTAIGEQGTIQRPDENLLHDIDWVSPFNRKETWKKFLAEYPDAIYVREIDSNEDYTTDTWLIAPEGHSIKNYTTETYGSPNDLRTIVKAYDVVNSKGETVGTYRLEDNPDGKPIEVVEGVEGKVIDFFSYEKYNELAPFQKGGVNLANWRDVFAAKLDFARYKDIWDYNRFIPNENLPSAEEVEEKSKEGLDKVFELNPELAEIGSMDDYAMYLTTIFPESQFDDILFSSSKEDVYGSNYLTPDLEYSKKYGPINKAFVVNLENPYQAKEFGINRSTIAILKKENPDADGFIGWEGNNVRMDEIAYYQSLGYSREGAIKEISRVPRSSGTRTVYVNNSSQKYELGSKQDQQGFKNYIAQQGGQDAVFFQEPLNTRASIEKELLKSRGIKRYKGGLMITKNGYFEALKAVQSLNNTVGYKAARINKANRFGAGGREIFYININAQTEMFQDTSSQGAPNEELNKKLKALMSDLGLSLVNYDEYAKAYKEKYGKELTANAAADMMNRTIAVREGTEKLDTLSEEVAHFIVYAMKDDPRVQEALAEIENTSYWQKYSDIYKKVYNNNMDKVRLEIVGKMMSDVLIENITSESSPWWKRTFYRILNAFNNLIGGVKGNKKKERRIKEGLNAIASQTLETPSVVKERIESMKPQEDGVFFQIDPKMFENSKLLDNMDKELEEAIYVLKRKVDKYKARGTKEFMQAEKDLIKSLEKDLGANANEKYNENRITQGLVNFISHAEGEADAVLNRLSIMREAFGEGMYQDELEKFAELVSDMNNYITIYEPIVDALLANTVNDRNTLKRQGADDVTLERHDALIDALKNIQTGITQMSNDYVYYGRNIYASTVRPFIEQYYKDKTMTAEERETAINRDFEELLKLTEETSEDNGTWNRWLTAMSENPDKLMALTDNLVKDKILSAQMETLDDMRDLYDMDAKLKNSGVENTEFVYERDSNGELTGNYVSEINEKQFNDAKKAFYEQLHKDLGLPEDPADRWRLLKSTPTLEAQYIERENEWVEKNTDLNPEYEKMLLEKRRGFIADALKFKNEIALFDRIVKENPGARASKLISIMAKTDKVAAGNLKRGLKNYTKWKNSRIWTDYKGDMHFRKEFAMPKKSIYGNSQYDAIMANPAKKEYYEKLMAMREKLTAHMSFRYSNSKLAPQIRKDILERLKSDRKRTIQETLKDLYQRREDDTQFGMQVLDERDQPIKNIPIYYSSKLSNMSDLSLDATATMAMFANMANRHRNLVSIQNVVEITGDVLRERQVTQSAGVASTAERMMSGGERKAKTTKGGESYKRWKDYIDMVYYGELKDDQNQILPDSVSEAKIVDALIKYTAVNSLALNVYSGISNITLGNALIREEAFAKQYITQQDLSKARKAYWTDRSDGVAGLMGDIGNTRSSNKLRLFLERFDVLQDFENRTSDVNTDRSRWGRMFKDSTFFFLNHAGEHQMQSRMALGLAFNKKVLNKEGKQIDFYDALVVENNRMKVQDGIKNLDGSDFTDADVRAFIMKIQGINQRLHGIYNVNDRNALQKKALGRAAMLFRKWFVPSMNRRFEKKYRNYMIGDDLEGFHRTAGRFYWQLIKELKEGQLTFASAKENYNNLSDADKANVTRSMVEVGYFLAASILGGILTGLAGDDDDDYLLNMAAYQAQRFSTELGIFIPVWNSTEIFKLASSPSAAVNQVESLMRLTKTINPGFFYNDDPFFKVYKAGRNKDKLRIGIWARRQIPMADTIEDWFYPEERLKYFIR